MKKVIEHDVEKNLIEINKIEGIDKNSLLLDSKQTAFVLSVSKGTIENMRRKEKIYKSKNLELPKNIIQSIEIGGKVMYQKRKIAEFLARIE